MRQFGVHSEVGKLRTVMVCRPGLAHQRLTPGNCHDLLFDDVIWVHEAQKDHYDFVLKMRERGVEVLELHEMLAGTLEVPEGRRFILDRRVTANMVGTLAVDVTTDRLELEDDPNVDATATAERYAATLVADIADALPEWRVIAQAGGRGTAATINTDPDGTLTAAAYATVEAITDRLAHSGAYIVAR